MATSCVGFITKRKKYWTRILQHIAFLYDRIW